MEMLLNDFLINYLNCITIIGGDDEPGSIVTTITMTVTPRDGDALPIFEELHECEDVPNALRLLRLALYAGEAEYEGREEIHALLWATLDMIEYLWDATKKP